jgi:hypothetical protein
MQKLSTHMLNLLVDNPALCCEILKYLNYIYVNLYINFN